VHEHLVFSSQEVTPFTPPEDEGAYASRLLIDEESVGSKNLVVNRFTLHPGAATELGQHPTPYDEFYYVLKGEGVVTLGGEGEEYAIAEDSVVFIPNGTLHALRNSGSVDLELITVMPGQLVEGANPLYDARKQAWGHTFKRTAS
jgi:mannose-6-phosphate isomerase-like protein (cupin superfamily)